MDERAKLDDLIAELTIARLDQVQAREDYQEAQQRAEAARVRAQDLTRSINEQVDRMTAARANGA
jgi:hypothetical protein